MKALEEAEVYNGDDVELVDEDDIDVDDVETDTYDEDDSIEVAEGTQDQILLAMLVKMATRRCRRY